MRNPVNQHTYLARAIHQAIYSGHFNHPRLLPDEEYDT